MRSSDIDAHISLVFEIELRSLRSSYHRSHQLCSHSFGSGTLIEIVVKLCELIDYCDRLWKSVKKLCWKFYTIMKLAFLLVTIFMVTVVYRSEGFYFSCIFPSFAIKKMIFFVIFNSLYVTISLYYKSLQIRRRCRFV